MRAATAAIAVALALGAAGCSGAAGTYTAPAPGPPPPEGTGFFVGEGPDGVGATLDLQGRDAVTAAIDAALRARSGAPGDGPVVGVASVVNDGPRPVRAPSFIATFAGGGAVPLEPAAEAVSRGAGPAAAGALALLGPEVRTVPAGGAATMYVVLRGAAPGEVQSVRMVVVPGRPVGMESRSR
jgi:hypothetical protein